VFNVYGTPKAISYDKRVIIIIIIIIIPPVTSNSDHKRRKYISRSQRPYERGVE